MTQDLIFFGSDQYSAVVLEHLIQESSIEIKAVVTDHHASGSPVEQLARTHNLTIAYYPTTPEEKRQFVASLESYFLNLNSLQSITGLCASFDHLIPPDIIKLFGGQLYNLHPSLLPQYRNVSPVQYAIALGDQVTGITLFRISPGIDDGEIIAQAEETILPEDTTPTLTPRLFAHGSNLFIGFLQGSVPCKTIKNYKVRNLVFTRRLTRDSGYIEWSTLHRILKNEPISTSDTKNELLLLRLSRPQTIDDQPSAILHALLRALTPWPTVWSTVPSKKGELRVTLASVKPEIKIKIAGKPKSISYSNFTQYYL